MKSFLKYLLATILGVFISLFVAFFIFLIIIGAMISSTEKEVVIKEKSILHINLSNPIPERTPDNPFQYFDFKNFKPNPILGLTDIVKNINEAKDDANIKGIYLDLGAIPTGFGSIDEIRNAILDFKKSGKFVVSYADYYTHGSYYLATAADSIFINPIGGISFVGLSIEIMFYKGAFEKLDVEPQVIRHGKFKSAVEPLINDKMSAENREQLSTLINSVWGNILTGISDRRKIDIQTLNNIADNLTLSNAKAALSNKFVDGILYKDEMLDKLAKLSEVANAKKLELVNLKTYHKASKNGVESKNKIALVYAQGEIVTGESDDESVGSETLSKAIRDARQDSSVKAIVMRINSPGGSVLASEIIWREAKLASKVKPVIVSMGNLAASGGYYIAAPADTIVADPSTLTGSIGVFGVLLNAKNLFNKFGITTDVVTTNKHGNIGSPFRPLTPDEKAVIQAEIENIYETFVERVVDGRGLTKEFVDSIGQGRIWSAKDAKRLGLVDIIGGLDIAIEVAAKKAKLTDYKVVELPRAEGTLESILSGFSAQVSNNMIKKELGEKSAIYYNIKNLINQEGILTRLPYSITIY
jgi:protease-4